MGTSPLGEPLRIAILGAGAMGSLFAAHLAGAGHAVWLIARGEELAAQLRREGVRIIRPGGGVATLAVNAAAAGGAAAAGPCDFVFVWVKAYDTAAAARDLKPLLSPVTLVVTLQNGLGNAESLVAQGVPAGRLIAGVTGQGATLLGPGVVRHGGAGPTQVGPWRPDGLAAAQRLAETLAAAGLPATAHLSPEPLLWGKLLVNAAINPITALLGVPNGELLARPAALALMEETVSEVAVVARAAGVDLPERDPWRQVLAVVRATAENRSSMLQDIERGRDTEIGAICGAVVREARRRGLAAKVNHCLWRLVTALTGSA